MKLKLIITTLLLVLLTTSMVNAVDLNPKNIKSSTIDATLNWDFRFTLADNAFVFETFDFPNDEFTPSEVITASSPFKKVGNLLQFSLPSGTNSLSVKWRVTNFNNRIEKITETNAELNQYVQPSKYVDITPAITQKARELTNGETNDLKKATLIADWIHRNIEYYNGEDQVTITASQVYSTRKGVCNEFTHLFASMLRSIGIPVRFVGGFVYSGEEWAPHAWAEVAYNGEWISFDPTYNEAYLLDGTHFKFTSGLDQSYVKEQLSFPKNSGDVEITRRQDISFINYKLFNHAPIINVENSTQINATSGEVIHLTTTLNPTTSFSKIIPLSIAMPSEVKNAGEKTTLVYVEDFDLEKTKTEWIVLIPNDLQKQYKYTFPIVFYTLGEEKNVTINAVKGKTETSYFLVKVKEIRLIEPNEYDLDQNAILSITLENKGNEIAAIDLDVNGNEIPWQKLTTNIPSGETKDVEIRTNATKTNPVTGTLTLTAEDKTQTTQINLKPLQNNQTQVTENNQTPRQTDAINTKNFQINPTIAIIATILILITLYVIIRKNT